MKRKVVIFFWSYSLAVAQTYTEWFTPATVRFDYYRVATRGREFLTFDAVYEEGPWPGSKTVLLDTLNLGENLFTVVDVETGKLLYSRGFSTICGEWQTTMEAMNTWRTFHETVRFPYPKKPVYITFYKRDSVQTRGTTLAFRKLHEFYIDPRDSVCIRREYRDDRIVVHEILINGSLENHVDILIVGDGYTKEEMEKFHSDAKHCTDVLFSVYPFSRFRNKFNVRALEVVSDESGIDKPDIHVWKRNTLGTQYNTFGSPRYILTEDNKKLRDIIGSVPYDIVTILVNDNRYGGGGIFNLYTTCFTIPVQRGQEWEIDYVYVHEFGHCFAGLGDEYYSSQVSYVDFYPEGVEPWEPNLTRKNVRNEIKWKMFIDDSTPVPTPWNKSQYDSVEVERATLNRFSSDYYVKREQLLRQTRTILNDPRWKGKVGLFEGGGYVSFGMYRPSLDCKMFSLNPVDFDPVCAAAIERMIEQYTK
ncbi:MAG: IgA Peptidase M64 [Bacteroidetes bacterium]|nr:IgA Peptidase M64 [Bacteroidota bacterium]